MNLKMIGRFLSLLVIMEAVFLLPALAISLALGEYTAAAAMGVTVAVMLAVWGLLWLTCRKAAKVFGAKEGMVCVGLSWVVLSLLGCLPFWLSREIPSFIDALFETASGFTTTGASILSDVESLSRGLLYWRSFTHWVGGMGVLVFLLAIAPSDRQGKGFTMHLLRAESPGPDVGKLVPRMQKTASILYKLYIALTVLDFLFLLIGGMAPLDAVCTALGTAGTGGFGIRNDSLASFSPYIQNVTAVFMFLFGINFSCYYLLLLRNIKGVLKDEELRVYILAVLAAVVLIVLDIRDLYSSLEEAIRHAAFQVCSLISTSGFSTTDYEVWPMFSKGILLLLTALGGCAGSTAGGFKFARLLLILKSLGRNIRQVVSPNKVQVVRTSGRAVSETVLDNANGYLSAYVVLLVGSFLLLSLDGHDIATNFTAALTTLNNVGPGFGKVGPSCNFGFYSPFSKLVMIFNMIAGRLEFFPMLLLFAPSTWKKH